MKKIILTTLLTLMSLQNCSKINPINKKIFGYNGKYKGFHVNGIHGTATEMIAVKDSITEKYINASGSHQTLYKISKEYAYINFNKDSLNIKTRKSLESIANFDSLEKIKKYVLDNASKKIKIKDLPMKLSKYHEKHAKEAYFKDSTWYILFDNNEDKKVDEILGFSISPNSDFWIHKYDKPKEFKKTIEYLTTNVIQ